MEQTHDHPYVDGLDVGHAGERRPGAPAHRRRREDRQETDGDPGWGGLDVDPEGDPRKDDDQHAWNVDLDQEESEVTLQGKQNLDAWKSTWKDGRNKIVVSLIPGRVGYISHVH